MIPIYEQGSGKGIGHNLESFLDRFHDIATEHIESGRAKALAFVFYDFEDRQFKQILRDQGVFAQLDRLSGKDLSIFYLHSGRGVHLRKFNSTLISAFGVEKQAEMPCVVFCKISSDGFDDISVAKLDSTDLVHSFHELYGVIQSYLENRNISCTPRCITWLKGSLKFLSKEGIKAVITELIKVKIFS